MSKNAERMPHAGRIAPLCNASSLWRRHGRPLLKTGRVIESKQFRGGPSDLSCSDDLQPANLEMLVPLILPRVEQRHNTLASVQSRNVSPLVSITVGAAERQITSRRSASVFFTDDVIHFAAEEGVALGDLAILTAVGCAFGDLQPEFAVDP